MPLSAAQTRCCPPLMTRTTPSGLTCHSKRLQRRGKLSRCCRGVMCGQGSPVGRLEAGHRGVCALLAWLHLLIVTSQACASPSVQAGAILTACACGVYILQISLSLCVGPGGRESMDYHGSGAMATPVEHLHPALQEGEEPGAKRQRMDGEMAVPEGLEQHADALASQVWWVLACGTK